MHQELLRVLGYDPSSRRLKMLEGIPGLEQHQVADPMIHGAWEEGGHIYADPHIPIIVPRHAAAQAADALGTAFRQAAIGAEYATSTRPNTLVIAAHHRGPLGEDGARQVMDAVTSSGTGFAPDIKPGSSTSYHFLYPYSGNFADSAGRDLTPEGREDIVERARKLMASLGSLGRFSPVYFGSHGAKTALLAEGGADKQVHPAIQQIADAYDSIYGKR